MDFQAYERVIRRTERLCRTWRRNSRAMAMPQATRLLANAERQISRTKEALVTFQQDSAKGEQGSLAEFFRAYRDLRSAYFEILNKKDEVDHVVNL